MGIADSARWLKRRVVALDRLRGKWEVVSPYLGAFCTESPSD